MTAFSTGWGIHWFRRDLRIPGNEALKENWKRNNGKTLGLFCFDSKFLSRPDFSHNRFAFFIKTLRALRADLIDQGGDLLVIDSPPQKAFPILFDFLHKQNIKPPSLVTWSRDYEPFARERDKEISSQLGDLKIETLTCRDHLLFEPHELDFYKVYSPFARKWFEKMSTNDGKNRLKSQEKIFDYFEKKGRRSDLFKLKWKDLAKKIPFSDALEAFENTNNKKVTIPIPEAGFFAAFNEIQKFLPLLKNYKKNRDFPSIRATSRISIFLKNGSITVPQIIFALGLGKSEWEEKTGATHFLKELVWREFYYSILFHRPDVEKKSFLPQYENIRWENNEDWFQKWKEGNTGFPIVDAGMRELKTTGWMHNRVRMIVASFLTKDLLIDWRWGENHFMKELLDGDLAPNNGGWQWAASTGCDPQPYFRIFNPWLQGAKFDPEGEYIKKFVPELRSLQAPSLHNPDSDRTICGYVKPIVDHSVQRNKALHLYKG